VIRNADWILDLGPEGGEDGGRLVGQGRPAKIAATPGSYTGQFLTRYYASTNGQLAPIDPDDLANDCHPEPGRLGDRVEGPAVTGAPELGAWDSTSLGAPSFPLLSAERVGDYEPGPSREPSSAEPVLSLPKGLVRRGGETADSTSPPEIAKPKRARRATPAEEDLASVRARAKRPTEDKTPSSKYGPRKKKTGLA
jgi:hypothetical protein